MSAFKTCAVPGCKARVLVTSGHENCSHHRPRAPRAGEPKYETAEKRERRRQLRARRVAAAGVLWA